MISTLTDFACQYGDTGVLINGGNTVAPFIDIKSVEGLDQPQFKISEKEYDGLDGGVLQANYESMRKITITGEIHGADATLNPLELLLDQLKYNYRPGQDPTPFYFSATGAGMRQVFCKSLGFRYSWESMRRWNSTPFTISLQAEDPTIYGTTQRVVVGTRQLANPGYSFNHAFNYSFGGITTLPATFVYNYGNKPVGFIVRFPYGMSVTNPKIANITLNKFVDLALVKSSLDYLEMDFYDQTVYMNQSSRRKSVQNEGWFLLQPGANELVYTSDDPTATGSIEYVSLDGYR